MYRRVVAVTDRCAEGVRRRITAVCVGMVAGISPCCGAAGTLILQFAVRQLLTGSQIFSGGIFYRRGKAAERSSIGIGPVVQLTAICNKASRRGQAVRHGSASAYFQCSGAVATMELAGVVPGKARYVHGTAAGISDLEETDGIRILNRSLLHVQPDKAAHIGVAENT